MGAQEGPCSQQPVSKQARRTQRWARKRGPAHSSLSANSGSITCFTRRWSEDQQLHRTADTSQNRQGGHRGGRARGALLTAACQQTVAVSLASPCIGMRMCCFGSPSVRDCNKMEETDSRTPRTCELSSSGNPASEQKVDPMERVTASIPILRRLRHLRVLARHNPGEKFLCCSTWGFWSRSLTSTGRFRCWWTGWIECSLLLRPHRTVRGIFWLYLVHRTKYRLVG